MKIPILTIALVFKIFWACEFCKFDLKIIHLTLYHLRFSDSVDIGAYLVVAYFESWNLTLSYFFSCYFLFYKFCKSNLYLITNDKYAQCLNWWHIVLRFIKSTNLTIFLILKWQFCSVNYMCQMRKLNFLFWMCSWFWVIII